MRYFAFLLNLLRSTQICAVGVVRPVHSYKQSTCTSFFFRMYFISWAAVALVSSASYFGYAQVLSPMKPGVLKTPWPHVREFVY